MDKIKNNWTIKLFALIIAIFLWSYVMSEVNPIITKPFKDVNVRLENIDSLDSQDLVVMSPETASINVEVSGPKSDVDKFTSANIIAEVDLTGYSEGEIKVPVYVSLEDASPNIKIENWEPREILFKFDKVVEKDIAVNVETVGDITGGYILEEVSKDPQELTVRGPRTLVNEISEARAIVDISNKTSSTNISAPVQLLNDNGDEVRGIEKDPGIVDVFVDISQTKTLEIELETISELPENINIKDIKIYPENVKVKGKNELENLEKIKTKAIDINELIGKTSMDVELAFPDGVKLVDPDQKISIRYTVEEIVEEEYSFSTDEISFRNLDEKYKLVEETVPSEVKIVLKGSKSIFDNIDKENLKLYVDLEDVEVGNNKLNIKFEEVQGISLESMDPKEVSIEIEEDEKEE